MDQQPAQIASHRGPGRRRWLGIYLKLSAALLILSAMQYILFPESLAETMPRFTTGVSYSYGVICLIGLYSIYLMMNWRRLGFWISLLTSAISTALNVVFVSAGSAAIGVLIALPLIVFLFWGGESRLWSEFK